MFPSPIYNIEYTYKKVGVIEIQNKVTAAENFAKRIWNDEIGLVARSSIVPVLFSSAIVRIVIAGIRTKKITGESYEKSLEALINANKSVKIAIVMIVKSCDAIEAKNLLDNANGMLRKVIKNKV